MRALLAAIVCLAVAASAQAVIVSEFYSAAPSVFTPIRTVSFENTGTGCANEAFVTTQNASTTTVDCDSTTTVLEGTESMEWSGTFAAADHLRSVEIFPDYTTGVVEIRGGVNIAAGSGTVDGTIVRTYNSFSRQGPQVSYRPVNDTFRVICNNTAFAGETSFTVVDGQDYFFALVYDIDSDQADLFVETTYAAIDTTGTPDATCDGDTVATGIDGWRLYAVPGLPYYLDRVEIGPHP